MAGSTPRTFHHGDTSGDGVTCATVAEKMPQAIWKRYLFARKSGDDSFFWWGTDCGRFFYEKTAAPWTLYQSPEGHRYWWNTESKEFFYEVTGVSAPP